MEKSEKHERYSVDGPNNGGCALLVKTKFYQIASVNSRIPLKDLYCYLVFYYLYNNIFVSNALIL